MTTSSLLAQVTSEDTNSRPEVIISLVENIVTSKNRDLHQNLLYTAEITAVSSYNYDSTYLRAHGTLSKRMLVASGSMYRTRWKHTTHAKCLPINMNI